MLPGLRWRRSPVLPAPDMEKVCICGEKDGAPAYHGIVSTDGRAWCYPAQWAQDGTAAKVFARTLQTPLACQPVALWRWLQDHRSEVLERAVGLRREGLHPFPPDR